MKMLKHLTYFFLISTSTLARGQESRDDSVYYSNSEWQVLRSDQGCSIYGEFVRGDAFYLFYNRVANRIDFAVLNDSFRSIVQGSEYRIDLYFFSDSSRSNYSTYDQAVFHGLILNNNTKAVSGRFDGEQFLSDFARFDSISLFYGDVLVGSYRLRGSADVAAALRRCDREVEVSNPTDPFSGTRAH